VIENYINTIVSVDEDIISSDWFKLLALDHPVTRTEVCLYFNEHGFDIFFTENMDNPVKFNVWIRRSDLEVIMQEHYPQIDTWRTAITMQRKFR